MNLTDIESFCKLGQSMLPGIKSISVTAQSNMSALGDLAPGSTIYKIDFRKWSGSMSIKHGRAAGGDYYVKTARVYVPRYRFQTENFITELVDRKVIAFVIDENDEEHTIYFAEFTSDFTTDDAYTGSNGYVWTFTGKDRRKKFYANINRTTLTGDVFTPAPGDTIEIGPAPETAIPVATGCCVTVLVTPIPEDPLASGNILNRNKFVTVESTGDKWFIDKDGVSIKLSGAGMVKERIIGTGVAVYTLAHTYDPATVLVNRNENVLKHEDSPPPEDIRTFNISGDQLILPSDWPLEADEWIEIYKVAS